ALAPDGFEESSAKPRNDALEKIERVLRGGVEIDRGESDHLEGLRLLPRLDLRNDSEDPGGGRRLGGRGALRLPAQHLLGNHLVDRLAAQIPRDGYHHVGRPEESRVPAL